MDDPLVEQENKAERLYKAIHRVENDEEVRKAENEYRKKPYWQIMEEEGDYLPSDAGMWRDDEDNS